MVHLNADETSTTATIDGDIARFHTALTAFKKSVTKTIGVGCSKPLDPVIDEYFQYVGKTGRPLFEWNTIRSAFLWKLEMAMTEIMTSDNESNINGHHQSMTTSAADESELNEMRIRILETATDFQGIPFTIQRLCELLMIPNKHYKSSIKYLRALEKTTNVVTVITSTGQRVTGSPIDHQQPTPTPSTATNTSAAISTLEQRLFGLVTLTNANSDELRNNVHMEEEVKQ